MSTDALARPDWRESLALAADLALLGIMVTLASLPVVTAGAALATASVAADHACEQRCLPPASVLWRAFRRGVLPGLGAMAGFATAALLIVLDLRALSAGLVPGGVPLLVATAVLAAVGLAVALLALVRVGATGGRGWIRAARWALRRLVDRPWVGAALLLVLALPVVLALAIPATAAFLWGFLLFALHVAVRRAGSGRHGQRSTVD